MTKYTPEQQRENLIKLRDALIAEPDWPLDMSVFAYDNDEAARATPEHPCGSSMCLIGSGPSMGIPLLPEEINHDGTVNWGAYGERAFCAIFSLGSLAKWQFCFDPDWPNSIPEAIARLTLAINDEIPKRWDYDNRFADDADSSTGCRQ